MYPVFECNYLHMTFTVIRFTTSHRTVYLHPFSNEDIFRAICSIYQIVYLVSVFIKPSGRKINIKRLLKVIAHDRYM